MAYDLSGRQRFVLRGGAGLFYDRPFGNTVIAMAGNPPASKQVTVRYGQLQTLGNGGFDSIFRAPAEVQLLLVYLGIGCTAVNLALWYYGLKHTSAAAASAFQYMIPPTSVALAALFLHESISPAVGLGTLCILIGLLATQIASRGAGRDRRTPGPSSIKSA